VTKIRVFSLLYFLKIIFLFFIVNLLCKLDSNIHNETSCLPKEDKGVSWEQVDGEERLRFHCNAYFRDFQNAVKKYYKLLIVDKNPNLLKNFNKALDRIEKRKISPVSTN